MFTAHSIKKFFKEKYSLKVSVRKVAVKTPFFHVWIKPKPGNGVMAELEYDSEMPADLGQKLLDTIYSICAEGKIQYPAGNVQRHAWSINEKEWKAISGEV